MLLLFYKLVSSQDIATLYSASTSIVLTLLFSLAIYTNWDSKTSRTFIVLSYTAVIIIDFFLLSIFYSSDQSIVINSGYYISIFNWFIEPSSFICDKVTLVFSTVTLVIGTYANIFSGFYLSGDKNRSYFIRLLNLFVISMVLFVKTNSLVLLVMFWEFLGISSFFLIGHYHEKPYILKSAFKAFSFNRISDLFLFLFTILYIYNYGTFSILFPVQNPGITELFLLLLLILTASVKSAQGIFFFWLPDSMEAPIPASALIHSATLVAAGIYLLIRYGDLISSYSSLRSLLVYHGILSAVIFSSISLLQSDIKKLLAYSTIANCGFMYFLVGVGMLDETLVYFSVHGLLKSYLFIFFGYIIISNGHNQDMQNWHFSKKELPLLPSVSVIFLSLGAVNLTMVYDIKHVLSSSNLPISCAASTSIISLFYLYSANSLLYSSKFLMSTLSGFKVSKMQELDSPNKSFISSFSYLTLLVLLSSLILTVGVYAYTPNLSVSYEFFQLNKLFVISAILALYRPGTFAIPCLYLSSVLPLILHFININKF